MDDFCGITVDARSIALLENVNVKRVVIKTANAEVNAKIPTENIQSNYFFLYYSFSFDDSIYRF